METKKTLETLKKGFLGCAEMPKVANSALVCSLNGKCASDDLSNVEIHGELRNPRIGDASVDGSIAGNDQINKENLGCNENEVQKLDNDVAIREGESESKTSYGVKIQDGKVEKSMERGDDMLHSPETTTREVSVKGINLFIEVFGPLNGMSERNHSYLGDEKGEHVGGGGDHSKECLIREDKALSFCVKRKSDKNGEEGGAGEQEHAFNVSDLVWVKTRSELWWPGIVSEPSDAASNTTKFEKRESFLVKYFGIANFVWCNNSDLKPFVEYFTRMSRQVDSRNFVCAVDKAIYEIGQRVKLNMTCLCFSREVECKDNSSVSVNDKHKTDALWLSQFEPAGFVRHIRDLARSGHVPGKVELTVMKNRLAAFYCSVGHREVPLQLLRSSSDAAEDARDGLTPEIMDEEHKNISVQPKGSVKTGDGGHYAQKRGKRNCSAGRVCDDNVTSSGKNSVSRERKKSKYLSYPYVDIKDRHNIKATVEKEKDEEELADCSSNSKKSTPQGRCKSMTSPKRGLRKPAKRHHIVNKAGNINASSAELLAELRRTAQNYFHIGASKHSDSLTRFFCGFRNFAFLDADKASKISRGQQEPDGEMCINLSEGKIEEVKASRKQRVNRKFVKKAGDKAVNDQVSETNDPQGKRNGKCRRAKKCEEHIISANQQSVGNCVGADRKHNPDSSCTTRRKQTRTDVPKNETALMKRDVCSKKSKRSRVGKDEKDNPKSSSMISLQQIGLDVPKSGTVPKKSEGHAMQSTGACVGMNGKDSSNSSCVISFQRTPSDVPKGGTSSEKTQESDSMLPQTNRVSQIPDLNGKCPIESVNQIPSEETSADLSKPLNNLSGRHQSELVKHIPSGGRPSISQPLTNPGMKGLVIRNVSGVQQTPSSKDTSIAVLQNIPKSNNPVNCTQLYQSAEFAARELVPNVSTNTRILSFVQPSLPIGPSLSAGKTERKERKRKQKTQHVLPVIPDLNGNALDTISSGKTLLEGIPISSDGLPPRKKGTNKSATAESGSKGKMKINEDPGGSLLLNFVIGSTLPSKETLVAIFSRFGLLNESEIQVTNESGVQIVYERSSDAKFAFRRLEKSSPFGEALAGFELHCTEAASKAALKHKSFQMPQPLSPLELRKNLAKPVETLDLDVIRKNVEMMKLTLERAGNTISPEMRTKLENEIKGFLDKISTMDSSSSSS